MEIPTLTAQNAQLRKLLEQAGLDAAQRDIAEKIQSVLLEEIHHRMKNMLAMVASIVRQSVKSTTNLADAEAAITARLDAMAAAQDILLKANWRTAQLIGVISSAIEQHHSHTDRVVVEGPDLEIRASCVLPLALVLNELCTNATKYGALSNDKGRVTLTSERDPQGKTLRMLWIERDGPPVMTPGPKSFGTRLIEEALPRQLGGHGRLSFAPEGVEFELVIPLEELMPLATA